ncbi:MAG: hypothetical protein DSY53_00470 [Persephonella sp.]|nr:MAG: hypothetical protein DSY53_00470 [Persephonella sp.]
MEEKDKISRFDMKLAEEITNLERFIIKSPLGTKEFWSEWQQKLGEIVITKSAIKKTLSTYKYKPSDEKLLKLEATLEAYKEIASYLELLRITALKLKGIDVDAWDIFDINNTEDEEDDYI